MSICLTQDYIIIGDYFFNNFVEGKFPIENWVYPKEENIVNRTTNGAKRFHQKNFRIILTESIRVYGYRSIT